MDARKFVRAVSFTAATFASISFGPAKLHAQEADSTQPAAQTQTPAEADEVPSLPDTRVLAKPTPGPFPREPLPDDAAITATRTETLRSQIGSSISVITEEQIRSSGQTTLLGVLRSAGVPGIDFAQNGNPGSVTSGFIRGANSSHTKVMMDGIPINDPSSPTRNFDFGSFSLDNVERVEIIRGPQSTLFGSDAIGGVVNIITKRGKGPAQFRSTSMGGTFGTWQQSLGVSGGTDKYYYSLSGSYLQSDGFSAADKRNGNREHDGFKNGNLGFRGGYIFNEYVDFDVVYRYQKARIDIDDNFNAVPGGPGGSLGFIVADSNHINALESNTLRPQVRVLLFDGALEQKAGFNYINYNRDAPGGFTPFFNGETRKFDYQANAKLFELENFKNTATLGVEYLDERSSTVSVPNASQFARSIYVQDQFALWDRWFTTVGGRHDDYSIAGVADTYRVTTRYQLKETYTAFHGTLGTGFRAPSLAEYFGFGGNTGLRPEQSKGWDVGVEQAFDSERRFVVDGTYFRNDFNNLINFAPAPGFPFGRNQNVDLARTTGVELTANWQLFDDTALTATYTHTDAIDATTNLRLLRRPPNKYSLGVSQFFLDRKANLSANLRWVDFRDDFGPYSDPVTFAPIRTRLSPYSVANLQAYYDWKPSVRFFGRIDNAFDQKYQEAFGFATPRFSVYAGVTMTFGGNVDGL